MKIRKLEMKDAPLMLEWMHDSDVIKYMYSNFLTKTIHDCEDFINHSIDDNNENYAIVSDMDEYMGTVSLKHIDKEKGIAEFAITVRKCAMGCGYSWFGMREIINHAFNNLGISSVYWCVSRENKRACRFYEKHHFKELLDIEDEILCRYSTVNSLKWFVADKNDEFEDSIPKKVLNCSIIDVKTIGTMGAGQLSFFESEYDFPFEIKRIYYITNVPEGKRRGFHAHKELKQLLFCPYGKITIVLDNGASREEIILDSPSKGLIIDKPMWREMIWLQKDSVLCVAASEHYNPSDYIRDYSQFEKYLKEGK